MELDNTEREKAHLKEINSSQIVEINALKIDN